MPPEQCRDVIQRAEVSVSTWPCEQHVVASADVCSRCREKELGLLETPDQSEKFTFPISIKSIKEGECANSPYVQPQSKTAWFAIGLKFLLDGVALLDPGKFLLAARQYKGLFSTDYVISLDAEDMSTRSNTYVGKLRSNILGLEFTLYESQAPHNGAAPSAANCPRSRIGSKGMAHKRVAHIVYALTTRKPCIWPRRLQCTLHTIPSSAVATGGGSAAPTAAEVWPQLLGEYSIQGASAASSKNKSSVADFGELEECLLPGPSKAGPLVLKNKAPVWREHLQQYCLNFRQRVTEPSVKNFQLLVAGDPALSAPSLSTDRNNVFLQFGKIGKDLYTMDYRYPLSAFQAFAICLSTFDTVLCCGHGIAR